MTNLPEPSGGWQLGRDTWLFHRQFFECVGRPAGHREYSDMLWQIRKGAEQLDRHIYRVRLADGGMILVRGGNRILRDVLPPDWQAPAPAVVVAPPVVQPRPIRATTLTLTNKTAATRVLTTQLKRIGIPVHEVIGGPP